MPLHKGLQTITWGKDQPKQVTGVLQVCADAGYEGVEIGFRHLAVMDHQKLHQHLDKRKLTIAATHIGGNLLDLKQAESEKQSLDDVLEVMREFDIPMLMYSGLSFSGNDELDEDVGLLNDAAKRCADDGRRLLYHNHAFEFDHDRAVIDAILQNGAAELGFCPDVGWVHKGGAEPIPFLEELGDRLGAVHLKDFASSDRDGKVDTVCLGQGVVPVAQVIHWLRGQKHDDLWLIAEQDRYAGFPAVAARKNAVFMQEQLTISLVGYAAEWMPT